MKNGISEFKRKIGAGVTAAVMGMGMLVNRIIKDPHELTTKEAYRDPEAHIYVEDSPESMRRIVETDEYEPLTVRETICAWMMGQPLLVRAFVLLPLWGIGEVLSVLVSSIFAIPTVQAVIHFIIGIIMLALLFILVIKLLFPGIKLRDIFRPRNILLIVLASVLITAADRLLGMYFERWKIWRIVIKAVAGLGILMVLIHKLMGKLKAPERRKKKVEIIID